MLLKLIKTESYGVLRHKPFHPSLRKEFNEKSLNSFFALKREIYIRLMALRHFCLSFSDN